MDNPQIDLQLPAEAFSQVEQVPAQVASSAVAVEKTAFWSVPKDEQAWGQAPTGAFVQEVHVRAKSEHSTLYFVFLGLVMLTISWFAWRFVAFDELPATVFANLFNSDAIPTEENSIPTQVVPSPKTVAAPIPAAGRPITPSPGLVSPNPYILLPYGVAGELPARSRALTGENEEQLRATVDSGDYYSRYKAIQYLAKLRSEGAEPYFREALQSGKFWLRMHAVIGLADSGYKVSDEDLQVALGDAHSELRARFFERFTVDGRCDLGCMSVVRGSIKYLDAAGRLSALKVIAKESSEVSAGFLVAALFDQDLKVQSFARNMLLKAPVDDLLWWKTFDIIFGNAPTPAPGATSLGAVSNNSASSDSIAPAQPQSLPLQKPGPRKATAALKTSTISGDAMAAGFDPLMLMGGVGITFVLLALGLLLLNLIAYAKLYSLAGEEWWAAFVPIYNMYVMSKIGSVTPLILVALFVPFINIFATGYLVFKFAKAFRDNDGYCALVAICSPIMVPIMAFTTGSQAKQG